MSDTYTKGKLSAIRNKDGIFINTQCFKEEALHFQKYGYYIADPYGSPAWYEYWQEQRRRCIEGYTSGSVTIPGDYYFYLNFCPIMKAEDTSSAVSRKVEGFPDFWDGDYNYFWIREIARSGVLNLIDEIERKRILSLEDAEQIEILKGYLDELNLSVTIPTHTVITEGSEESIKFHIKGGYNLIVGKSRRKGFSYKNAAVAACNYFTKPKSLTVFNAYEKKYLYPKGIFSMATSYINFINDNTGWTMPADSTNKQDHIKASYIQYRDGVKIEKGFKSEIMAYTCKDNSDANRGKDILDLAIEEAGAFGTPGLLKDLYAASEDCVKAGNIQTGLITVFGTSGDMEGGTADYADMHSRPLAFGLLPFNNIWDKNSEQQKVGYFHPVNLNMEGFYDKDGNSDLEGARKLELREREVLIKNGASSVEIQRRMQEKPLSPSEAFGMVSVNNFPVIELRAQLQKLKANDWQQVKGMPVDLYYDGNIVKAKPLLNKQRVSPITSYTNVPLDKRGVVVVYEEPLPDSPRNAYKIGYDPVRQDEGTSLAGIIVFKSVIIGSYTKNIVVAEYVGRKESPDDIDETALMLADYYNTQVMHENEVTGVKNYFRRRKRLDALAFQPDRVIAKNIKKSKTARVYGCHMTSQLKDAGERYIKEWLIEVTDYDENGDPIKNLDRIYSQRLLEELIAYNSSGNFDLISALVMALFQVQEEDIEKEYSREKKNPKLSKLSKSIEVLNR